MSTPAPLRQLPDGTPCWCVDADRQDHEPRCHAHRLFSGVKGEYPEWLKTDPSYSGSGAGRQAQRARQAARQAAFLTNYAEFGIIGTAAREAGIDRQTVYDWRKASKEFAAAMDAALEESTDKLEREATRRAREGWLEPVYQQGQEVGTVRKYSDSLLTLMLKANRPRRFRENIAAELTGDMGGPIVTSSLGSMDDHEKETLRRVLEEAIAAQREIDAREAVGPSETA